MQDRGRGAEEAVRRHGSDATILTVSTPNLTLHAGTAAADQILLLSSSERPTALFAANDLVALGLLQRLLSRGVRVPDDIAIVGYDDIEFAAAATVPLSSVRAPREELGTCAAELLFDEIRAREAGEDVRARHVWFEPELVVRESTG
jgi:LacI family transcriptional regulator